MGEFYSRAEKAVVWLSQAANGSDELIDVMLKFGQEAKDWGGDHYETKEHIEELRNIMARVDMTPKLVQYFKAALDELGIGGGPCRPPRLPLREKELMRLRAALARATPAAGIAGPIGVKPS